jgi:riboflavin kinase
MSLALTGPVTQVRIAKAIDLSQQTISRKLRELEDSGYIQRTIGPDGETLRLTKQGEEKLNACLKTIRGIIMTDNVIRLKGKVVSGLGEGRIFLNMPYYVDSFKKLLGFQPFPGTLNVLIYEKEFLEARLELESVKGIEIPEHREENRVLGAVRALPASVSGITPAALIFPARTVHPRSIVELISPFHLREKLSLKDGHEVEIEVFT